MMISSFLFKQKAKNALKGNWQTALLVTFLSTLFVTIAEVLQQVTLVDVSSVMNSLTHALGSLPQAGQLTSQQYAEVTQLYKRLFDAVQNIPQSAWISLISVNVISILLTPILSVSASYYFICRDRGEEIGLKEGLLCRARYWGRVMWLHILIFVRVFLWSMLFVIPGIIAGFRYSMALYYLAENPQMKAGEAIEKSKEVMKNKKFSYFMLQLSFVPWSLLITVAQVLLVGMFGTVITLVAAQFMSLAVSTYLNASCAAFYGAVSRPEGMDELMQVMRSRMREAGMSEEDIHGFGYGEPKDSDDENRPNE